MIESAQKYLLHKPPMIFVDDVIEKQDDYVVTQLRIQPELMFCEEQGLPTWASIEIMAQAVSVYAGVQGAQLGRSPRIGFLLGTRKLLLPFAYFPIGCELIVTAKKNYIHENLGMFDCSICIKNGTTIENTGISARLSVYEPEALTI